MKTELGQTTKQNKMKVGKQYKKRKKSKKHKEFFPPTNAP